ncbi:MAG: hypothetical protein BroJett015_32830 [Chloroflexota bacterium]|nr:O-antigen ligase family protein [Ardenticatenaceae bacterium]GIK57620.1 MAG: hypothetical protein BroJett015_32830 [Chloroflexota bacterium]
MAEFYIQRRWQLLVHKLLAIAQIVWVQRVVIVTAVLLFSLTLPFVLSRTLLMLVIGLILGLTAVLILLYRPQLGLLLLVAASLVLPSPDLPGGLNLTVLFLLLLIGLWFLEMFVVQRNIWVVRSRPVKPLLALLLVVLISLLFGQLPWFRHAQPAPLETQIGGMLIFICAVGAFLLTAQQIRELYWLQWMTWIYIAMSAFFVAGWVVPGVGPISSRLFHIGAISNSLFWTWLVALAFGQAVFNNKLNPFWRLVLLGITAMTLFVGFVLNNEWKSGYLPPIAAVAVILALRSWRLGLIMILIAPIGAYFLTSQAIATDDYSYGTRVDAWIIVFEIIKVNPILGLGPANYYWYTPLFPIRGWAVSFNSHNQYVDIIAQTGLVGMLCVIWFAIEQGLLGWRLKDRVPDGFARAYVYCVLGGLVGTLVGGTLADWFFPFVYNIGYYGFRGAIPAWIFLGGLVSLEQMYASKPVETPRSSNPVLNTSPT